MRRLLFCWALAGSGAAMAVPTAPAPLGLWRTQMHGALVEIRSCAAASPCGFLTWVDPAITLGQTRDIRNPDIAKRSRPLVGVPIIWGLKPAGAGWNGGRVYNPETGQIFRSSMQYLSARKLKVTGCWGPLCRSEIWIKVDAVNP